MAEFPLYAILWVTRAFTRELVERKRDGHGYIFHCFGLHSRDPTDQVSGPPTPPPPPLFRILQLSLLGAGVFCVQVDGRAFVCVCVFAH